ncbi:hypothetical protein CPJCM30710_24890 [Clostridium polyendosporum]|uniref:Uncharacterized protein n=1 Tax=Clostridium polyendosporum TaxID=69208 RepID=A0A919VMQ8_9CLOT|nr:hypothetical protein [Clostridium polyendosporum]GIM29823.1 hypothetical protein CPJCM30710_24890 [Clostridium polyendosporum]
MGSLSFDIGDVLKNMAVINDKVEKATYLYAETAGKKIEGDAKKNAHWIDRTGLTRQGLNTKVVKTTSGIDIRLSSPTYQFKYLELAHEKKYAIAWPTIKKFKGEVLTGWANVISKIR